MATEPGHAVVLLSGGMDSATCLALAARRDGHRCHALSFDYGQRHRAELDAAARIARLLGALEHRTLRIDLGALGGSALTDRAIAVPEQPGSGIAPNWMPPRSSPACSARSSIAPCASISARLAVRY